MLHQSVPGGEPLLPPLVLCIAPRRLQGRATFVPSPYLDAHGEEDKYMKRGK